MSKYLDPETETLRLFHYLIVELVGETYQIETRCAKKMAKLLSNKWIK